jgi:type III restriction enzyme
MSLVPLDTDLIEEVTARLSLREPNKAALTAVATHLDESHEPLDAVCDLATGVGKTYIAAALVDYLYEAGIRNILVVTPGTTILNKTLNNFTPGHPKFVNGLGVEPMVITSDDFDRGAVAHALADDTRLKMFVFNVQQLIKPTNNVSRKVRDHDEDLGGSLYEHLQQVEDLVVIADEHHVYFGKNAKAFTAAVRDLNPLALIGLTATPSENTPAEKIIYHYPLAAAIADGYVKVPVLVARKDGQTSLRRQLADGLLLLSRKREALETWCAKNDRQPVNPVMFVVCETIDDANEVASELRADDMLGTDEAVLVITSESPEEALAALDTVEDQASPVRAIVSVQMLKEGWDVKNIYVICALRALESKALSEQILGRGLRLPFGSRTGVPMLDTVEVLSHRRFHDLLANARALLEATFGERAANTVAETGGGQEGTQVATDPTDTTGDGTTTRVEGIVTGSGTGLSGGGTGDRQVPVDGDGSVGLIFEEFEQRAEDAEAAVSLLKQDMGPVAGAPVIMFPRLEKQIAPQPFTLSDVADDDARVRGLRYRDETRSPLERVGLEAVRKDDDTVDIAPAKQTDDVHASQEMLPVTDLVTDMAQKVLGSGLVVPDRRENRAVRRLITAFLDGAGVTDPATAQWSQRRAANAAEAFLGLVREKHKARPSGIIERVAPIDYPPGLLPHPTETLDRYTVSGSATFVPGKHYTGWTTAILPAVPFDAYSTEYRLADLLDSAPEITWWIRVLPHLGAYILWGQNQKYIPDFIAIDTDGVHWLIEGKSDARSGDKEVLDKKTAAERWVRHVNDSGWTDERGKELPEWRYLFANETQIKHAAGSWNGLRQMTG